MGVRTEDATFKLAQTHRPRLLHDRRLFQLPQPKGRDFHLAFDTRDVNANGWGWKMVEGDCARPGNSLPFHLGPHTRRECDDVVASVEYSSLAVKHPEWAFVVTAQPVYDRVARPAPPPGRQGDATGDETVLKPHGILGQSFDGDERPRMGALDVYPDKSVAGEFTTKAMAEGAIEGAASDYALATPRATAFNYSRFATSRALPTTRGATARIARATDDGIDETQITELRTRRLSESLCPCPSPPSSPPPPVYYTEHATLTANGFDGITEVKAERIVISSGRTMLYLPLIRMPGMSNCDPGTSNGWFGVHGGGANVNGDRGCDKVCNALDLGGVYSGWTVRTGSGYDAEAASIAPVCTYRSTTEWVCPYSQMPNCFNAMHECECESHQRQRDRVCCPPPSPRPPCGQSPRERVVNLSLKGGNRASSPSLVPTTNVGSQPPGCPHHRNELEHRQWRLHLANAI